MAGFADVRRELSDLFKARGIVRIVYFHCDHFEPWVRFEDRQSVDPRHVEDLHAFADDSSRIDYARKLTLFYRAFANFAFERPRDLVRAHPDDFVGFVPPLADEDRMMRDGMKYIVDNTQMSLGIHIHHEGFTSNTKHTRPDIVEFFHSPLGKELDGKRLELAIELAKKQIRNDTGIELGRWFFVHGHWALQASDETSCNIPDELSILMRQGCRGDFTFPAGRELVNPRCEAPYFCRAIDARRGYDLPESDPELAYGNRKAAAENKFFIWNSPIKHTRSSLDYYAPWVRNKLEEPEAWARDIVKQSFAVDGTLFFKTHAHSMFPYYREGKRRPVYPHAHPGIQTVIGLVLDSAAASGAAVEFLSADEVYDRFVAAPTSAQVPVADMPEAEKAPSAGSVASPSAAADKLEAVQPQPSQVIDLGSMRQSSGRAPKEDAEPVSVDAAARLLNGVANATMKARIEELGERESGAYNYYASRVQRGAALADYEVRIARMLVEDVPRFDSYHEIGSGIGVLPMLLALVGMNTVGIEFDRRRSDAGEAVFRALKTAHPAPELPCELIYGRFPDAVQGRDVSRVMALITNFVATTSEELLRTFFEKLREYGAALVDVDRFVEKRTTDDERRLILARFRQEGFGQGTRALDLGEDGQYYLFVPEAEAATQARKANAV